VEKILEFLYVTTLRYHLRGEYFKFHRVVYRHYSGKVENVYIYDFAANLFRKLHTKFHQNHWSFVADITKQHFVSFFAGHTVLLRLID